MIRTTAVPRSARTGAALVGVAGVFALAGCSAAADAQPQATTNDSTDSSATTDTGSTDSGATASGTYADGTYTEDGSYIDGGGMNEDVSVTITLKDDVVTAVKVTGDAQSPQTQQYQSQFIGGISAEVVGKNIDDISVSRVAGSSLTSNGFNDALEKIKQDAAA